MNSFDSFLESLYSQDIEAFEDGYQFSNSKKNHFEMFNHHNKGYLKIKYSKRNGISIDKGYKLKSSDKKVWKFSGSMDDITYEVKKYINKYFKSLKTKTIRK